MTLADDLKNTTAKVKEAANASRAAYDRRIATEKNKAAFREMRSIQQNGPELMQDIAIAGGTKIEVHREVTYDINSVSIFAEMLESYALSEGFHVETSVLINETNPRLAVLTNIYYLSWAEIE